jgi:hypothetical protein
MPEQPLTREATYHEEHAVAIAANAANHVHARVELLAVNEIASNLTRRGKQQQIKTPRVARAQRRPSRAH